MNLATDANELWLFVYQTWMEQNCLDAAPTLVTESAELAANNAVDSYFRMLNPQTKEDE